MPMLWHGALHCLTSPLGIACDKAIVLLEHDSISLDQLTLPLDQPLMSSS